MGKLNKHANLYDSNGEKIREAPLKSYNIQELEDLIDKLEPGKARDNATMFLFNLYQKCGNPHEEELIKRIMEQANNKVNEDQVRQALGELGAQLQGGEAGDQEEKVPEDAQSDETEPGYNVNSLETEDATIIEE